MTKASNFQYFYRKRAHKRIHWDVHVTPLALIWHPKNPCHQDWFFVCYTVKAAFCLVHSAAVHVVWKKAVSDIWEATRCHFLSMWSVVQSAAVGWRLWNMSRTTKTWGKFRLSSAMPFGVFSVKFSFLKDCTSFWEEIKGKHIKICKQHTGNHVATPENSIVFKVFFFYLFV